MRRRCRALMPMVCAVVCAILAACSHKAHAPAAERLTLTLPPASFAQTLRLRQLVHVDAVGRSVNLDAVLDIAPASVTLVGMVLGLRVLTMQFDGQTLTEQRSALLPSDVHGADILTDLELALWPADAVRASLPAGWTLTDDAQHRTLAHDGKQVTDIVYDGTPRWEGVITLKNLLYNYQLSIRSAVDRT